MDTNLEEIRPSRDRGTYRHHSLSFKRELVELSLQSGASVSRIAREHGVNANQVFNWRKAYREGKLEERSAAQFLPIALTSPEQPPEPAQSETVVPEVAASRIVIERQGTRLIVEGASVVQTLSQVLQFMLR